MTVSFLPVGVDAPGNPRQNMIGQSWHPDMRQNQKAAIVGNQGQALRALLDRPTNPSIPRGTLPGGRTKQHAGQIDAGGASNQVANVLPNGSSKTKVVMLAEVSLELSIVRLLGADHLDLEREQRRQTGHDRFGPQPVKQIWVSNRSTSYGCSPPRRKNNPSPLVQLEQQGPSGHILEHTRSRIPLPLTR
jgi:hypothetical protein